MTEKPLVGISACLLGEKVRYDGGHKLDHYLRDLLGRYVEYLPVCPEVECGMTTPREALRLVQSGGAIRLMTQKSKEDKTVQMTTWVQQKVAELSGRPLCGFIFKSRSPSSGLMRVKVYREHGGPLQNGVGLFAAGVTAAFPFLPAEDDGRLNDSRLRENFIERIFVMHRWHQMKEGGKSLEKIIDFHSRHKYILMAHCPKTLKEAGAFLGSGKRHPINLLYAEYFNRLFSALGKIATVSKNTNVLLHLMGYFKKDLTKDEKEELRETVESYHNKLVPLIVPVTLINHYVRKYTTDYLEKQFYLHPHPMELMLRNHV